MTVTKGNMPPGTKSNGFIMNGLAASKNAAKLSCLSEKILLSNYNISVKYCHAVKSPTTKKLDSSRKTISSLSVSHVIGNRHSPPTEPLEEQQLAKLTKVIGPKDEVGSHDHDQAQIRETSAQSNCNVLEYTSVSESQRCEIKTGQINANSNEHDNACQIQETATNANFPAVDNGLRKRNVQSVKSEVIVHANDKITVDDILSSNLYEHNEYENEIYSSCKSCELEHQSIETNFICGENEHFLSKQDSFFGHRFSNTLPDWLTEPEFMVHAKPRINKAL